MCEALFVDIQRGSIHDGPGIRTTLFLKGCPLHCAWCHNPESQSLRPQLSFHSSLCTVCGSCVSACANKVHTITPTGEHIVNLSACIAYGACVQECMTHALHMVGKPYTLEKAMEIARRDIPFYRNSGGGVTLSGGEPLSQWQFAERFLSACKREGIHTCVETCGQGSALAMTRVSKQCDLIYFDWKLSDAHGLAEYTGGSLETIKNNLIIATEYAGEVVLRCPIIPGINNTDAHFEGIIQLLLCHPDIKQVHLLPYHDFGTGKAVNVGMRQQRFTRPERAELLRWQDWFYQNTHPGCRVMIEE